MAKKLLPLHTIILLFSSIIHAQTANDLYEKGFELRTKNTDSSVYYTQRSLERAVIEKDSFLIARSYLLLGSNFTKLGDFKKAMDYNYKAIEIGEDLNDSIILSAAFNNFGNIYQQEENYERSLIIYKKSLSYLNENDENQQEQVSSRYYNIGLIHEQLDELDQALSYYYSSLAFEKKAKSKEGILYALYGIAGIQTKRKEFADAEENLLEALSLSKEINDRFSTANCLAELGWLEEQQKNWSGSNDYYFRSVEIAKEIEYSPILSSSYKQIANNYKNLNNYKKAYDNFMLYDSINSYLDKTYIAEELAKIESKYVIKEKEKELQFLKERNKISSEKNYALKSSRKLLYLSILLIIGILFNSIKDLSKDGKLFMRLLIIFGIIQISVIIVSFYSSNNDVKETLDFVFNISLYIAIPLFIFLGIYQSIIIKSEIENAQELKDKIQELQKLSSKNSEDAEDNIDHEDEKEKTLIIKTPIQKDTLEIKPSCLLFVSAEDNYCTIYWYDKETETTKNKLIRSTLKSLEGQFSDFENIMRCHKSFIVNLNQVENVTGNSQNYKLIIKHTDQKVSVSRTFPKTIIDQIKSKS